MEINHQHCDLEAEKMSAFARNIKKSLLLVEQSVLQASLIYDRNITCKESCLCR